MKEQGLVDEEGHQPYFYAPPHRHAMINHPPGAGEYPRHKFTRIATKAVRISHRGHSARPLAATKSEALNPKSEIHQGTPGGQIQNTNDRMVKTADITFAGNQEIKR